MTTADGLPRARRVLFVIGSLNVGGAERHLLQVVPELKRRGWDAAVFCLTHRGTMASAMEADGVPVLSPDSDGAAVSTGAVRRVRRLTRAVLGLLRHLRRQRPDVVHFFLPEAYLVGGLCAWAAGMPCRVMSRRSLNNYQRKRPLVGRIERWLHGRMQLALGNSRAVVGQLHEEGFPVERTRLIYNGLDLAALQPRVDRPQVRAALGTPADALVFVQVANLIPYKGHEDALAAFHRIHRELPAAWEVWMVGRDDGIGERLRARTRELGLESHVRWLGTRSDVADLLAAADVSLLCSHEEGFSNAILESMAAGLPVVATDVGGNAEAVVHGRTGLIVPARDPARLGEALRRIAQAEPERRAMGKAARERVAAEFSLAACVDRYELCYRELLEPRAAVAVQHPA